MTFENALHQNGQRGRIAGSLWMKQSLFRFSQRFIEFSHVKSNERLLVFDFAGLPLKIAIFGIGFFPQFNKTVHFSGP